MMRPQIFTSALLSAAKLATSSATTCPTRAAVTAIKPFLRPLSTCAAISSSSSSSRPFSASSSQSKLVRPNAETVTTKQEIPIPTPKTPVSMSSSTPISANAVLDLVKNRRTYYALNKDLPVPASRVQEIIQEALQHVPSSFNSQSNRVVALFGADHDKLWDMTSEVLRPYVDEANWANTAARMAGFRAGAATLLFFDDQTTIFEFQKNIPLYKDKFPTWATQSNAMLQYALWVALEAEGLGANLQHYNPLIDERVVAEWGVPTTWQLAAQLVIGGRAGEPGNKDFKPVEEKLKVFGA
ncbi:Nitroreductase-like protein [Xylariaceae sp. FL0016]|nr:Nitroreductase-like protein [Xylariaceae sp. FL0016]